MKSRFTPLLILALSLLTVSTFTSCKKEGCTDPEALNYDADAKDDDGSCIYPEPEDGNIIVNENISGDVTWTSDNVYQLSGRITVLDGAKLTIEPGTVIKGEAGTRANATALLVARGGTIDAQGTPTLPIIFTSVADEITPEQVANGDYASPNLDPDINGLWGGVLILGRAPISASNSSGDVSEVQIEGIPATDPNGLYGGNDPADNSGIFKYVSIRHGGANIGQGNEINGLSLGAVGDKTIVENIEIVANQDDGVEWFGGTVNVKNVVVWNTGDDGLDTDQSWDGSVDNFFIIAPAGHCFELDGPEGSMEAGHKISNGLVMASDTANGRVSEDLINMDDNSIVDLENIHITAIQSGQQVNRVSASNGNITFTNVTLDVPSADLDNFINGTVPAGITAGGQSTADASVFGWTWTSQAGKL